MIGELKSQPSVDENDVNEVTDAICNILITSEGKTLKKRECPWFSQQIRSLQ